MSAMAAEKLPLQPGIVAREEPLKPGLVTRHKPTKPGLVTRHKPTLLEGIRPEEQHQICRDAKRSRIVSVIKHSPEYKLVHAQLQTCKPAIAILPSVPTTPRRTDVSKREWERETGEWRHALRVWHSYFSQKDSGF